MNPRKGKTPQNKTEISPPKKHASIGGILLFYFAVTLIAGGLIVFVTVLLMRYNNTTEDTKPYNSLVYTNQTITATISPADYSATHESLADARADMTLQQQGIGAIEPTQNGWLVDAATFLSAVTSPPKDLLEAVTSPYIYGTYSADGTPFIMVSITDSSQAQRSMMMWHRTIADDLSDVLNTPNPEQTEPRSITIANKPAITLKNQGRSIVSYMFIRPDVLAITSTPETLRALLTAYQEVRR